MSDKKWGPANTLDVFGDPLCRKILIMASESPISATALADHLDVAPPTIYRRTDELSNHDFIRERETIDENGNHYRIFETAIKTVTFEIEDGGYTVNINLRRDLTDEFESFWTELADDSPTETMGTADQSDTLENDGPSPS